MSPPRTRTLVLLTAGALFLATTVAAQPINATSYRLVFLVSALGTWLGLLLIFWKRVAARVVLGAFAATLALILLLPGRAIDRDELRASYLARLLSYEGTDYAWGGENGLGIDCSGLPRRALRDAVLAYGVRDFNGDATRMYVEQWWFDTSAKALGQGYRDFTIGLGVRGTIASMSYESLLPGDLAVTDSGVHVMVYVGAESWIQADPLSGSVITLNGRTGDSTWFQSPITMHRWKVLAASGDGGCKDPARTQQGAIG